MRRVMQQLQKSMKPQMLAQMGGAKNLMSMMKNIDMNAMKKMMGQFYSVCCSHSEREKCSHREEDADDVSNKQQIR